jgi:phosphoesterase RecJ-like protein
LPNQPEHTEEIQALRPEFLKEVRSAKRVVIGSHLNPDGDALGSSLACAMVLDQLGVKCEILCHHLPPTYLEFLPGMDRILQQPVHDDHDLALILDLESLDRLGTVRPWFEAAGRQIVIDHHVPHMEPGDLRIVDQAAPATAAILCDLFFGMEGVEITPEIADCLLVGILTDTGNFKFPNTTPHSLHLAGQLLESGANLPRISEEVYMSKAIAAVRLLGAAISSMETACNDRLAWSVLPYSLYEELGAKEEHTEGIVNELLSIETTDVAAIFRESKPGKFKISLRSRGDVDVAMAAREFGGGGHQKAAGLNVDGTQADVVGRVTGVLKRCLESS